MTILSQFLIISTNFNSLTLIKKSIPMFFSYSIDLKKNIESSEDLIFSIEYLYHNSQNIVLFSTQYDNEL